MIALALPSLPPSSNHAYVNNGFGGRTLSAAGRRYKREAVAHLVRNYPSDLLFFEKNTPYLIYVRFYFDAVENKGWPAKTKNRYKEIDVTNRVKLFEDALKDAAGISDAQHLLVLSEKRQGSPERTEVFAWRLDKESTPIDELLRLQLGSVQRHRALPAVPQSKPPRSAVRPKGAANRTPRGNR